MGQRAGSAPEFPFRFFSISCLKIVYTTNSTVLLLCY